MTSRNPCDPAIRIEWLRWEVSDELAEGIAPGLREGDEGARRVLVGWLTNDRERLISHCHGAVNSVARHAGIEPFTREDVAHEIGLVAWCHGLR
jgi:xanthine dehydrogenase iron-sulfur cluster and FAD-binding subunit A